MNQPVAMIAATLIHMSVLLMYYNYTITSITIIAKINKINRVLVLDYKI
jgi:hypothetical protein